MFHLEQLCEAGQPPPDVTDKGTSALLTLHHHILHKCNCSSFLDLEKVKTKKWVLSGHSLAHLTATQK